MRVRTGGRVRSPVRHSLPLWFLDSQLLVLRNAFDEGSTDNHKAQFFYLMFRFGLVRITSDEDGVLKVTDFGLAKAFDGESSKTLLMSKRTVTPSVALNLGLTRTGLPTAESDCISRRRLRRFDPIS